MATITASDIEAYQRDGVVCLRGVIGQDWIERLREGVEQDLAAPGPDVEVYTKGDDPGLFFNDFDLWRHIPTMKAFALDGPCAAIAAQLMRSKTITFMYDHLFVKEPGTQGLTRWHQDQPYMAVDGWQFCSNWIPLDPIVAATTLEFVRGSHRWSRWFAPIDSLKDGSRHPSKVFERMPDIEEARQDYDIVSWELEPGDCLFFHGLAVHQGRSNPRLDTRRRTLTHRWLGDDVRYILRDPPAEFPKNSTALKSGEPFRKDPQFPVIIDS
ncbi:MAG: phytanoyl-CoA dioxygenase [Alphaproteobacteria bacterium]|nr:phytanoyl-CoA dioxygenase [Alphaproteobacteria bacterium]